jgi:hypothetical protein
MGDNRTTLKHYKAGDPCSRCGSTKFTGGCICGDCFCDDCIDAHYTEDDPDFCLGMRRDPERPDLRVVRGINLKTLHRDQKKHWLHCSRCDLWYLNDWFQAGELCADISEGKSESEQRAACGGILLEIPEWEQLRARRSTKSEDQNSLHCSQCDRQYPKYPLLAGDRCTDALYECDPPVALQCAGVLLEYEQWLRWQTAKPGASAPGAER